MQANMSSSSGSGAAAAAAAAGGGAVSISVPASAAAAMKAASEKHKYTSTVPEDTDFSEGLEMLKEKGTLLDEMKLPGQKWIVIGRIPSLKPDQTRFYEVLCGAFADRRQAELHVHKNLHPAYPHLDFYYAKMYTLGQVPLMPEDEEDLDRDDVDPKMREYLTQYRRARQRERDEVNKRRDAAVRLSQMQSEKRHREHQAQLRAKHEADKRKKLWQKKKETDDTRDGNVGSMEVHATTAAQDAAADEAEMEQLAAAAGMASAAGADTDTKKDNDDETDPHFFA